MKKIIILLLLSFAMVDVTYSSPPSRIFSYESGEVIDPGKVTQNEDSIFNYLSRGVDTFSGYLTTDNILDGTLTNADISGTAAIADTKLATITTAGKVNTSSLTGTISASNLSGVTLPSGAVFFMITGSCPTGTTDVTATYSNKFIKINATQGTSSGVVLTGTSDSHTLTTGEMPAHTHTTIRGVNASDAGYVVGASDNLGTATTSSTGGGSGHTHTLSTATTLEPSSITMKCCQVN